MQKEKGAEKKRTPEEVETGAVDKRRGEVDIFGDVSGSVNDNSV